MFHIVTNDHELFAVGWILPDDHVKGGTGWGVELAKLLNRKVSVFDQDKERWYTWTEGRWQESERRSGLLEGGSSAARRERGGPGREAVEAGPYSAPAGPGSALCSVAVSTENSISSTGRPSFAESMTQLKVPDPPAM